MPERHGALIVDRRGSVTWVAMEKRARPDADLIELLARLDADRETRVLVLTGADEKVFCVGGGGAHADDPGESGRNADWFEGMEHARNIILSLLDFSKPIVGRINGHAVGKGCSLALCCDITVIAEEAKIGDTHVKVGLACGDGGSLLWPFIVGPLLARRYLLTGDLLDGREAERIGLVNECVARNRLDERTDFWTGRLMEGAPAAVTMTKRAMSAWIRGHAREHLDMSLGLETLTYLTEDHREGAAALLERRPPKFVGR